MGLKLRYAYDAQDEVRELFGEYTKMLVESDSVFEEYLKIQNYDEELQNLEYKYGLPDGRLYLAYYDGALAGCIGLKKIDEKNCEMKRLYVRPQFRGKNIGSQLIAKIIEDAKNTGYRYMLLDTLPQLESAVRLYRSLGFYETDCYNNSPIETTLFMKYNIQ